VPTNLYFDNFTANNEQRLYDDLINECVQIYGIDAFYMPMTSDSKIDLLFGEDPTKIFTSAYPVEVYVQSVDNFEGGELFSKFGLEVKKQARFLVTRRSFQKNIPSQFTRPQEGSLLWLPNFQALFEIKYTDEEMFFYTFGNTKIYGYSMICEKFRYSNERINTDIDQIDDTMDTVVTAYNYLMANVGTGSYLQGELVFQGTNAAAATANASVVSWNLPSGTLVLKHVQGIFTVNSNIVGTISGAQYNLLSSNTRQDVNSLLDNNSELQQEANAVLNWTENNPFGEPL
jgi:Virus neck protein